MYHFSYYKETEQQVIIDFMEEHQFAFLTGSFLSGQQVATQIPVLIEQRGDELFVQGHIMRNTDHHKAFIENPNALIVFTGPNCYVSASWYSNQQSGSTWNYMSVHLTGQITFMQPQAFADFMRRFTLKFENGNQQSPTIFDNLPADYIDKMMPGIAGFEMKAQKVDNVFKLSQNRDAESYGNIIAQLRAKGGNSALIAEAMQKREAKLFSNNNGKPKL